MSSHGEAPVVSVVVPTRNRLALLEETLASVAAQTFPDWELIVVDDASSDETSAWLRAGAVQPLTALRLERNEGMSVARNRGFERARGELVMFLDDDDLLRPDALAVLVGALRSHQRSVAAVGARRRFSGDTGSRMVHPDHLLERVIWRELLAGWSAVSGQNLYRADAARAAGPYDPRLRRAQDRDLWLRVARLGPVVLCPEVVLDYRVHDGQEHVDTRRDRAFLYQRFIDSLPASEQPRARRIRDAGRRRRQADEARERGARVTALRRYGQSVVLAPRLATSPLIWPALVRGVLDAARGRRP